MTRAGFEDKAKQFPGTISADVRALRWEPGLGSPPGQDIGRQTPSSLAGEGDMPLQGVHRQPVWRGAHLGQGCPLSPCPQMAFASTALPQLSEVPEANPASFVDLCFLCSGSPSMHRFISCFQLRGWCMSAAGHKQPHLCNQARWVPEDTQVGEISCDRNSPCLKIVGKAFRLKPSLPRLC